MPLPWRAIPPDRRAAPYPLLPHRASWAVEEAQRWCRAGFARRLSRAEAARARWVSPAFVADRCRKPRLVIDLSYINNFLYDKPFRYEGLALLLSLLHPDDYMVSWDVKDAFHHLILKPADGWRLVFRIARRFYLPLTLFFGLKLAPWAWTKLCRTILQRLRSVGFDLIGYMEESLSHPPGESPLPAALARAGCVEALDLFADLGVLVHPAKGTAVGTQRLEGLGYLVDTHKQRLLLLFVRLAKVLAAAAALQAESGSSRRWVSRRRLRCFCGLATSTALAVPLARFQLRQL